MLGVADTLLPMIMERLLNASKSLLANTSNYIGSLKINIKDVSCVRGGTDLARMIMLSYEPGVLHRYASGKGITVKLPIMVLIYQISQFHAHH